MYKKVKEAEVPKSTRKTEARFERSPDWLAMKSDLDRGLRKGEALQVLITDADKAKYKIKSRLAVSRFIKRYVAEAGLDLAVKSFRSGGEDYVVVRLPR